MSTCSPNVNELILKAFEERKYSEATKLFEDKIIDKEYGV